MEKKTLCGLVIAGAAGLYSANALADSFEGPVDLGHGIKEIAVLDDSPSWGNSLDVNDLGGNNVTVGLRSERINVNSRKASRFNMEYGRNNLMFCYFDRDPGKNRAECQSAKGKTGLDLPEWLTDGLFSIFLEGFNAKREVARVDEYHRVPNATERDIGKGGSGRSGWLRNPFGSGSEESKLESDVGRPSGGYNLTLNAVDPVNCPPSGSCELVEDGDPNVYRRANVESGRYIVQATAGHTFDVNKTAILDRDTGRQVVRRGFSSTKTAGVINLSLPSGQYEVRARVITGLNAGEETDVLFIDAKDRKTDGVIIPPVDSRARFLAGVRLDGLLGVSDLEIPATTVGTENLSGLATAALGYHGDVFGVGLFGRFGLTQFQANGVGRTVPLGTRRSSDKVLVGTSFRADAGSNRPLHLRVSPGVFLVNRLGYDYDAARIEREAKRLESFAVDGDISLPKLFYSGEKFYWGIADDVYVESLALTQTETNSETRTNYGRKTRAVNRVLTNLGYGNAFELGAGWQFNSAYSLEPRDSLNEFNPPEGDVNLSGLTRDNLTGHQAVGYLRFGLGDNASLEFNGMGNFRGENKWYGAGFAFSYRDNFSVGGGWSRNLLDGLRVDDTGDRFMVTFELATDRSRGLLPSRGHVYVGDR